MADIQHSDIQDANCHEPKHITSSTTADSGKVITPSGSNNGQSVLRLLTTGDISNFPTIFNPSFASAVVTNTTNTFNLTGGNIESDGTYDNIMSVYSQDLNSGMDFGATNTDQFTVDGDGYYRLSVSISGTIDSVTSGVDVVAFKYRVNTSFSGRKYRIAAPATLEAFTVSFEEILDLNEDDTIDVHVGADTDDCTLVISDSSISVHLVEVT